jgi:hypothetical protein
MLGQKIYYQLIEIPGFTIRDMTYRLLHTLSADSFRCTKVWNESRIINYELRMVKIWKERKKLTFYAKNADRHPILKPELLSVKPGYKQRAPKNYSQGLLHLYYSLYHEAIRQYHTVLDHHNTILHGV